MTQLHMRTTVLVLSLAFSFSARAQNSAQSAAALARLSDGPPALAAQLNDAAFISFSSQKLAHAKAWYVDYEYFRRMGVSIPSGGIANPTFAKSIVDAFGWQARGDYDEDGAFLDEQKLRYTDYYGGYGMGTNLGSGRAGMNGHLQAKGEITPLAKSNDPFHSNGAVQTIEAVDEAIWSQVLDQELKMGSNKVVAIILTGTYAKLKSGQFFPRALIIRESALRPAHFMINYSLPRPEEVARVKKLMPRLLEALPYPSIGRPKDDKAALKVGVLQLVDLEAAAEAEYFAKRMFFGSVTPSNLEITGRRLDLGDHTSNPGFTKIYRLDWQDHTPFGEIQEFLNLFSDFRGSLEQTIPPDWHSALPTTNELHLRFAKTYQDARAQEMVLLTGVPQEIASSLKSSPSLKELGELLVSIARDGNTETVFMDSAGWENKGTYDLGAILNRLAMHPEASLSGDTAELLDVIADTDLRNRLAKTYSAFVRDVLVEAGKQGVLKKALQTYMKEAVKLRNASRPSLVRGDRRWHELWETTDKAINENNPLIVQTYIEEQSAKAIFNHKDALPFQLVLKEDKNSLEGLSKRLIYDARRNLFSTVVRLQVANEKVSFKGRDVLVKHDVRLLLDREIRLSPSEKSEKNVSHLVVGTRVGNWVEFTFAGLTNIDLGRTRLVTHETGGPRLDSDLLDEKPKFDVPDKLPGPQTCEALF